MSDGQVRLYDREITKLKNDMAGNSPALLVNRPAWKSTNQEALVLRSDMAYELGGGTSAAVSGLAFTTDSSLVESSGVFLLGKDLQDIKEDTSYARITLLLLDESVNITTNKDELYQMLRRIEYTRYHVYPEGYMMRISAVHEREPVRISQEALREGMNFASVGQTFIEEYKKNPGVKDVQVYFITDESADYLELGKFAKKCDDITQSLNQVFKGFSMDCSTCGQKELCDEIDGLKELHLSLS